jgi:hypothetical protein
MGRALLTGLALFGLAVNLIGFVYIVMMIIAIMGGSV